MKGRDAAPDLRGMRVLITDDSDIDAFILGAIIQAAGAGVDRARSGSEALKKFTDSCCGQYDVIFMDMHMPKMTGCEACLAIRGLNRPDAKTVPIFLVSSEPCPPYAPGFNSYISKPVDRNKIYPVIRKIIKKL